MDGNGGEDTEIKERIVKCNQKYVTTENQIGGQEY